MSHTSGPWSFMEDCVDNNVWAKTALIASVNQHEHETNTSKANARLIAAAPDLLNACQSILDELSSWVWETVDGKDYPFGVSCEYAAYLKNLIKPAVQKAKGDQA